MTKGSKIRAKDGVPTMMQVAGWLAVFGLLVLGAVLFFDLTPFISEAEAATVAAIWALSGVLFFVASLRIQQKEYKAMIKANQESASALSEQNRNMRVQQLTDIHTSILNYEGAKIALSNVGKEKLLDERTKWSQMYLNAISNYTVTQDFEVYEKRISQIAVERKVEADKEAKRPKSADKYNL